MRQPARHHLIFLCALFVGTAGAATGEGDVTRLRIEVLERRLPGRVTIAVDGTSPIVTELRGGRSGTVVYDGAVPEAAEGVLVTVSLDPPDGGPGPSSPEEASGRFLFHDPDDLLAPFRAPGPFRPAEAFAAFARAAGFPDGRIPGFEFGEPAGAAALAAAEARLGYALHPDHVAVLAETGPPLFSGASVTAADEIAPALRQLQTLWEDPPDVADELPDDVRALLGRSTMVMVIAGDGLAALLFDPDDGGVLWAIDQETMDEPVRLEGPDGRPLSFREALGRYVMAASRSPVQIFGPPNRLRLRRGEANRAVLGVVREDGSPPRLVLDGL